MNKQLIIEELQFKAVRSSGAGGQHVNKVATKIELSFDVANSEALSDQEKKRILIKLKNKINKEYLLLLQCSETRSQHKNKLLAIQRFLETIEGVLRKTKKRRKTKPSKSSIEKRLKHKKIAALKKRNRRKPNMD